MTTTKIAFQFKVCTMKKNLSAKHAKTGQGENVVILTSKKQFGTLWKFVFWWKLALSHSATFHGFSQRTLTWP